jgi:hypothetical protein
MPGIGERHGAVTPIAKTAARQRYWPAVVSSASRPSGSRRVDSQRQPYRTAIPARSAKAAWPATISSRVGTA